MNATYGSSRKSVLYYGVCALAVILVGAYVATIFVTESRSTASASQPTIAASLADGSAQRTFSSSNAGGTGNAGRRASRSSWQQFVAAVSSLWVSDSPDPADPNGKPETADGAEEGKALAHADEATTNVSVADPAATRPGLEGDASPTDETAANGASNTSITTGEATGEATSGEDPIIQRIKSIDHAAGAVGKLLRKKGNLTLKAASLRDALFTIKEVWKINISLASDVDGTVDAAFFDTPLYEILENLLTPNGYSYRISGQTLQISRISDNPEPNPLFETVMVSLKSAQPDEILQLLRLKQSIRGQIEVMASSRSLLISDFPERLDQMLDVIRNFESQAARRSHDVAASGRGFDTRGSRTGTAPSSTEVRTVQIPLKNIKVGQIVPSIQPMLSPSGRLTPLVSDNKLVIVDFADKVEAIEQVAKDMDSSASKPVMKQYVLKHARVAAIQDHLKSLVSSDAHVNLFENENRIVVTDYPRVLEKIDQLLSEADTPASTPQLATIIPEHAKVGALAELIQRQLSAEGVIKLYEAENRMVVIDYPTNLDRAKDLVAQLDQPGPAIKTITLSPLYIRASTLAEPIQRLITRDGKVTIDEASNRIVVSDNVDVVQQIERLVRDADNENDAIQPLVLEPQFVSAEQLMDDLSMLVSDGRIQLQKDENRILIVDYPSNLQMVKLAFQRLDVPRPQVRITVLIYDMSIEDTYQLGLNWRSAVKARPDAAGVAQSQFKIDSIMSAPVITDPAAVSTPTGLITFMNLSESFDLAAVIHALSSAKNSRLLADPNITVVNKTKGKISIVTEIPIQQLTQAGNAAPIGTTTFKEAGVVMEVTPWIADDRTIQLHVKPTFSRLIGFTPGASANPILDKREAETTVRVRDRQMLVMGGLRQRNEISQNNKVPCLGDIRKFHLGKLFNYDDRQFRESELVVFIMPEIVSFDYPGRPHEADIGRSAMQMLDQVPGVPPAACENPQYNGKSEVEVIVPGEYDVDPPPAPPAARPRSNYGKQAAGGRRAPSTEAKKEDKTADWRMPDKDRFADGPSLVRRNSPPANGTEKSMIAASPGRKTTDKVAGVPYARKKSAPAKREVDNRAYQNPAGPEIQTVARSSEALATSQQASRVEFRPAVQIVEPSAEPPNDTASQGRSSRRQAGSSTSGAAGSTSAPRPAVPPASRFISATDNETIPPTRQQEQPPDTKTSARAASSLKGFVEVR